MQTTRLLSTAVLSFLLGSSIAAFAQQQEERRDEVKPPRPEQPRREEAKPPRQDEAKPPRQEEAKPPRESEAKPPRQQREEQAKPSREQQPEHPDRQAQQARPAGKSAHIPDERFHANFGRQHTFVVNRPVVVQGHPQFAYGGYTFVFVDPWPVEWAYTDDCYIEYIDGEYFLFDVLHPGVRVAVFVVM